jgi:hypothetical protein
LKETAPKDRSELGYELDGHWDNVWVEVKSETHGLRNVRASLLELAYWLTRDPGRRGLLLLTDSRISEERLRNEWSLAERTLNRDILRRLSLVLQRDGRYIGLPQDLGKDFRVWLEQLVRREAKSHKVKSRESFYDILEVLLHQWLLGKGSVTSEWLKKTVGCSYPTVASSLRRLETSLLRHSDRRVELRYFPREEWWRLLAVADEVRSTSRFVDRSGQPQLADVFLKRLKKLGRNDIAVGGVIGARHYQPRLDLVGTPRLDLSVHSRAKNVDLSFIRELDPALKKGEGREEAARVVIHIVRRADPLFEQTDDGTLWADPVECLLDLQESRLEEQAQEFVASFPGSKGKSV